MKLTYLVTVYNEVKTVKKAIEQVVNIKYKNKEIIVIDNGSTDGSVEIINKFNKIKKILRKKNLGIGKTMEEGFKNSTGDFIFVQFSDLEYDHKRSIYMMNYAIKNNLDIVLGSRLKNKDSSKLNLIIKKPAYIATIVCTFLINFFYKKNFTDIIGGKLYKRSSILKIPINSYHYGFDFEFISRACKKLNIDEVAIAYKPRKNSSEKKIKFYHMLNALYEIFKVKFFE